MTDASYYQLQAPAVPPRPPLTGAVEAEVAVVGGGLAGLGLALSLNSCTAARADQGRHGWRSGLHAGTAPAPGGRCAHGWAGTTPQISLA